jgi:hypothetical protein
VEEDDELAARRRITQKFEPGRASSRTPLAAPEAVAVVVAALLVDVGTREALGHPAPTDVDLVDAVRLMKAARTESARRLDFSELTLLDELRRRGRTWGQIGEDLGNDPDSARQWASTRRARLADRFPGVTNSSSGFAAPAAKEATKS